MAERHVSIPKPFAGGDIGEWLQRFEICSKANSWTDATKALKLPTLLEGEALAVWLEMSEEEQASYNSAEKKLKEKMRPAEFVTLDEFHRRKLRPDEPPSLYLHELKKLLQRAIPDSDVTTRKQLLKHQFIAGLPTGISRQMRASGDTEKELDTLVDRARLLMTIDEHACSAAIQSDPEKSDVQKLQEQVATLTEQVAALTTTTTGEATRPRPFLRRCFICNRPGHIQYECPSRRRRGRGDLRCFACNRLGHLARDCRQGNDSGAPVRAGRCPPNQ